MTTNEIIRRRLGAQQITTPAFHQSHEVVRWMVAMQAQEYAMAKWAIGLRLPGSSESDVEAAFNAGKILRTHVVRPTWHFVTPADIRWLLQLTAPRVRRLLAPYDRRLGIDAAVLRRSHRVVEKALGRDGHLTREELQTRLERSGLPATGQRLAHLMMHAELDALICSGPRRGRKFTYALLAARAPDARVLERDAARAELARRYFASRGPATVQDLAYWSGLTVADARAGADCLGSDFVREQSGDQTYLLPRSPTPTASATRATFLMPDYDEYGASYRDRAALLCPDFPRHKSREEAFAFNRMIVVAGRIVGTWQRKLDSSSVTIATDVLVPLHEPQRRAVARAIRRFCAFVGKSLLG